jgi:hypothetical protein
MWTAWKKRAGMGSSWAAPTCQLTSSLCGVGLGLACLVKGAQQWLSSFGSRLRKAAVVCCSADFLQYCGREGSGGGYAVSGQGFGGFGRGVWKGGRTAEGVCLQSREHPPVWKGMVFRVSRQGGL